MDSEDLLERLADIHLPVEISYWPPAPGWWVLALLLIAGAVFLTIRFIKFRNLQQVCRHALIELENCYQRLSSDSTDNQLRYVNEVNSVMRRVALVHFPQANVASLGGDAWVDFIRQKGDSSGLNEEIAAALSFGRFQTHCEVDVDAMNNLGQAWITSLYLGKQAESDQQGISD
jgi:hypothetical protein